MNTLRALPSIIALSLTFSNAFGQDQGEVFVPEISFKVIANGVEKTMAFSGGFNTPQFAMGDLNNDGVKDLVVYEKGSVQIKTFINYGTPGSPDYRYRQKYERNFPVKYGYRYVMGYLKLEDYNCDNVPDLIHRGLGGFSVYRGYYNSNSELSFTYFKDLHYTPLTPHSEDFGSSTFSAISWLTVNTGWSRESSGSNPTAIPQSGTGMARFNSANLPSGNTALLISKKTRISSALGKSGKVSFWMYRSNAFSGSADSISVYLSPDASLNNARHIGAVARSTSINLPDTKPTSGWYQYTFHYPGDIASDSMRIIFAGTARGGNNMYIDNVYWLASAPFGDVNAYVEPGGDIPGIVDIDNDGDLDFLSYYIGGGHIHYYKNYRVEQGLDCDSILIHLKDACWGRTYQGYTTEHTLGVSCPNSQPVIAPAKVTHTGNTLCFLDADGDEDYDYLNGGVSFSSIQYLKNGKTDYSNPVDTIIAQDTAWQSLGHRYRTDLFPAAFWLDIDQDGKRDVLISPTSSGSENYRNVSFYKNTGTNSSPAYTFQTDTLMVSNTIDMGTASYPMIYDYNKDGKPDLFVGGEGFYQGGGKLRARIAYYENTSNGSNLSFTQQTTDFLGLHSLNIEGAFPAVGDLDNDGKDDLVIGHKDGTLTFYSNQAPAGNVQPQWQLTHTVLKDASNATIEPFMTAAPFIYDMDKDGKKDLLIGGQSGWLAFYKNVGSTGQLSLQHQTSKLGNVKSDPHNMFSGFSAPFVGRIDNTPIEFLLIGSNSGTIYKYRGFENGNVTNPYTLLDTAYSHINALLGKWSGFRSTPAVGDLDGDGKYEMILGNIAGGIFIYKQDLIVSSVNNVTGTSGGVEVYPNPAGNVVYINWDKTFGSSEQVEISIYSITGQKQLSKTVSTTGNATEISTASLAPGTYICNVTSGTVRKSTRLVIIK